MNEIQDEDCEVMAVYYYYIWNILIGYWKPLCS